MPCFGVYRPACSAGAPQLRLKRLAGESMTSTISLSTSTMVPEGKMSWRKATRGWHFASHSSAEGTIGDSLGRQSQVCDGNNHAFTQSQRDGTGSHHRFYRNDRRLRRTARWRLPSLWDFVRAAWSPGTYVPGYCLSSLRDWEGMKGATGLAS